MAVIACSFDDSISWANALDVAFRYVPVEQFVYDKPTNVVSNTRSSLFDTT